MAGLVEARWGHRKGDDGGCFAAALESVRRWGGVLEHPAYSSAWMAHMLPRPDRRGGWQGGLCGGWACHVEQGRYGHLAKKATWLYAHGISSPPDLRWGFDPDAMSQALVSWCENRTFRHSDRPRLGKRAASATPPEFRDMLLSIAKTARTPC